jgi:methionine-rich copper-binding protein CopC
MAWITASAGPAEAHPVLIGAEPASGSVLSRTPARVHLAFSEPIEPAGAEVQLNTADGQTLFRGGNSRPSVLELRPESLGSALYEVRYEALGRDGHFVSGTYRFAVWPPGTPRPEGLDEVARETGGLGPQGRARGIAIALSVPLAGLLLASAVLEGRGRRSRRVLVVICAAGILAGDAFAIEASGRAVLPPPSAGSSPPMPSSPWPQGPSHSGRPLPRPAPPAGYGRASAAC